MAASWRLAGRSLRTVRGRLIRRGSRRWRLYWLRHPGAQRQVYRQGKGRWMAGQGWAWWPGSVQDLPIFVTPMAGADLRPLALSVDRSNRLRVEPVRFVSMRFLVTEAGISEGVAIDPDQLRWLGGQYRVPLSEVRSDLVPLSREGLEVLVQERYVSDPRIAAVTAIYAVSVQAAN